ncbi:MAG TPA: hypothetical protein VMB25_13965 [Bryobacteraceae bacterium]|nr:hypothetical protein [Bryobacteraceae bacterium]
MHLHSKALGVATLTAASLCAQIPSYHSVEDYCRANPQALPTCRDGKPLDVQGEMEKNWKSQNEQWEKFKSNLPQQTAPNAVKATAPQVLAPAAPSRPGTQYTLAPTSPSRSRKGPVDIRLGELDWRLVPPQSDLLLGLNMNDLLQSNLARTLLRQGSAKLGVTQAEQDKLLANLGDISQAVVSVRQNDVLVVLVGHLDDFPESNQNGRMQSVKVSPGTVILGSNQALHWSLSRLKLPFSPSAQVKEAQLLARAYQIWAWGSPTAFSAFGQKMSGSPPVNKINFGISLRDQFRMDLIFHTPSPLAAKQVLEKSAKTGPNGLTGVVEGSAVHYTLLLDRAAALDRFAGLMSDSVAQQVAPLLAAARQMSASKASAVRPSPGKVVIEGLDDGPIEVPLQQP